MEKILLVDDDPNLLAGLRRQLRRDYDIDCAQGAPNALQSLREGNQYAVIVSDMRMPEMNGVDFLETVAQRFPDPVRIMLTGNADQKTAIDAVNKGHVFSFLTKPCAPEQFCKALDSALEQFRLKRLEKDLLERTLAGSVKVLLDVMRVSNPLAFGRSCTLREPAEAIARQLGSANLWEIKIATLLSSIGWISVPEHVLDKLVQHRTLTPQEREFVTRQPEFAYELLGGVPRLNEVARIVRYQDQNFDGSGGPDGKALTGEDIPLGSRILKVLHAVTPMDRPKRPTARAIGALPVDGRLYDPAVILVAKSVLTVTPDSGSSASAEALEVPVGRLLPGDVLEADLIAADGTLLLGAGNEMSELLIAKLRRHPSYANLVGPVLVLRQFHR